MQLVARVLHRGIDGGPVHVLVLGGALINCGHGVHGGDSAGLAGDNGGHVGGALVGGHEVGVDKALLIPLVHKGHVFLPGLVIGAVGDLAFGSQLPAVEYAQTGGHHAELAVAAGEVQDEGSGSALLVLEGL